MMTAALRPSEPTTVNVALGDRAYDIVIGRGLLASLGQRIAALRPGARVVIVTDETVARAIHQGSRIERRFAAAGIRPVLDRRAARRRLEELAEVRTRLRGDRRRASNATTWSWRSAAA